MKISKLLNKIFFLIIFFLIIGTNSYTEEKPVDIWNIDKKQIDENSLSNPSAIPNENQTETITETNIYDMQSQKQLNQIKLDENINSKEIKIIGLYDPEDHGLDINMWLNSNGDQLKNIFSKLEKIELSDDASEIMNISLLTNSYMPNKNITDKDFLRFKSEWLIKDSNLNLIEDYSIKNQIILDKDDPDTGHHYLDQELVKDILVGIQDKEITLTVIRNNEKLNLTGKVGKPTYPETGILEDPKANIDKINLRNSWMFK